MKLLMLKGLPASGKSTYARELVDKGNWVRVNKDDLRAMAHSSKYSSAREGFIISTRNFIVKEALKRGKNVVVDDTNFLPAHEKTLHGIAEEYKAEFEVKFFDVDVATCIERDTHRAIPVGSKVIRKMYNDYLKPGPKSKDASLPRAVICDIDGTLAHHDPKVRSPYEWDKVDKDTIDVPVQHLVESYMRGNPDVLLILMSGRKEVCREKTIAWLRMHGIDNYSYLYMRPDLDDRKDSTFKAEVYETHINGKYNIDFVLDDRNQVVEMWRSKGLKCIQVEEGDF